MGQEPTRSVQVEVVQTGERYSCSVEESLLVGMLRLGKRGIPVGCTNGGCGVCKVRVIKGRIRALGPMSAAHVDAEARAQGFTLACRTAPVEDVTLEVCRNLRKPFAGVGDVLCRNQSSNCQEV